MSPSLGFFDAPAALSESSDSGKSEQEVEEQPAAAEDQSKAQPKEQPHPVRAEKEDEAAPKRTRLLSPEEAAARLSGATASYVFVAEAEGGDAGFYAGAGAHAPHDGHAAAHIGTESARSIDVAPHVATFLLAGSGRQIKALEDASGCRVVLDRGESKGARAHTTEQEQTARKVTLVGSDLALREGERRLHEVVLAASHSVSRVIKCSATQAGALIGRGGATVKRIQGATSTHVSVSSRDELGGGPGGSDWGVTRLVTIKGASWHVEQAARFVYAFMRDPEGLETLLTEASAAQPPSASASAAAGGGGYGDGAAYDAAQAQLGV